MKKLWYKILTKLIGGFVREEISEFYIEMEKAIKEAKKSEEVVYTIPVENISNGKKKKVLEKVKKEMKKVNKETKKKAKK